MADHEFVWIIRLIKTLSFPLFPSHHRPVLQYWHRKQPDHHPPITNPFSIRRLKSSAIILTVSFAPLNAWYTTCNYEKNKIKHKALDTRIQEASSSGEFCTFYWTQEDYRASARLRMRPRAREGAKRALSEDNGSVAASAIRQSRLQLHNSPYLFLHRLPRHLAPATTPATTITLATTTSKWQLRI